MTKISKTNSVLFSTLIAGVFSFTAKAAEIPTNAALMQAMDKVTGRVNKITVPVNSKISFGDFSLVLRSCKKRPAEEAPENFAFADVTDKSFGTEEYNIFRGWLLSSAPGINAIEHPIYDVWLLECIDTEVDASKLLSADELAQRDALPVKADLSKEDKADELKQDNTEKAKEEAEQKVIRIKEFIEEDRDIEKDFRTAPAYISEPSADYISDIEEGGEPENLLLFTKMQEETSESIPDTAKEAPQTDELSKAIEAEIRDLNRN
ncbi:MAG: DUF2155 domain-containing protein [Alphaproteobacteria bacterium]|nr:DUF2155 domain-containing protein [Alphaproteobacteria bacterium]